MFIRTARRDSRKSCPYDFRSKRYLEICRQHNQKMGTIQQRFFHNRILRNNVESTVKRIYIDTNPYRWSDDEYFFES